jgi:hypothetical protein
LESLATMVDAPLDEAAVVRALSIVPELTFEALMPLIAAPLPVNEAAFIAPASNSPLAPRRTIVAPTLLELAVVLALSIVPEVMLEALIAVKAIPLPETAVNEPDVPEITLPAKEPSESRATIVEAPLAEAAVVLALSKVPEEMLEALMAVKAIPLPDTFVKAPVVPLKVVALDVVAFTTLAVKLPFVSRSTIVLAPLAKSAVVNAFEIVPLLMLEALMLVSEAPLPEMLALIVPVTVTLLAKVAF